MDFFLRAPSFPVNSPRLDLDFGQIYRSKVNELGGGSERKKRQNREREVGGEDFVGGGRRRPVAADSSCSQRRLAGKSAVAGAGFEADELKAESNRA
ncbi:hypothetical protein Syun_031632 [Stephania yunnanensis]|uniref:Uncharacterized protein n=1 Tax=Stephania yunnanensis TaxID=152371 RepID=A0AAP0HBI4_9MAGN